MNFSNNFSDIWSSRFPGVPPPTHLDCLKADQFSSLLEQKRSMEFEESKRCSLVEELKQRLTQENFVIEFLHKCIQKLGAVSQVFNEIDQGDSKSSSSSSTVARHPGSCSSPTPSVNGSSSNSAKNAPIQSPNFSLFPHCIASSLMQSASPLLAAAAATPTPSFLLPSNIPPYPCTDSIKVDPDPEPSGVRNPNFLLSAPDRSSYEAISRLSAPSLLYNNPFNNGSHFNSHPNHSQTSPLDGLSKDNSVLDTDRDRISMTSASQVQAQAAAVVAAALGLGLSSVRTRNGHSSQLTSFGKPEQVAGGTGLLRGTFPIHHSTASDLSIKEGSADSLFERPYQCSTCSRSFAVKAGLVQHMRTHTDERPYPCLHCGRAFKQKIQLTTHMRVHSGERPYGCRLCGKLFRQQSHVVQHLRTHTGEKPHKCYQCGKAFRQKYSLISHQRRMCRNRAAANPIAAGMTMWISPGVGGNTCNLVKEFSPARSAANASSTASPSPSASTSVSVVISAHSPFSPYAATSPVSSTTNAVYPNTQHPGLPSHRHLEDSHLQNHQSNHLPSSTSVVTSGPHLINCRYRGDEHTRVPSKQSNSLHDPESDIDDQEEDDDFEQPMCSSSPSRHPTPQKTTPVGLS